MNIVPERPLQSIILKPTDTISAQTSLLHFSRLLNLTESELYNIAFLQIRLLFLYLIEKLTHKSIPMATMKVATASTHPPHPETPHQPQLLAT